MNVDELIEVEGYPNELLQCFMNIFNNAKDILESLSYQNKYIFIDTYKDADNYIIKFRDNAGGIPQQIVDRIWEPYFSTKKDLNGTGLGLYMVKNMVEKHMKGKILLKNDNKGASFVLLIPHIVI